MFQRGQKTIARVARKISAAGFVLALLSLAACVTVIEKPHTEALLYTTRSGDTVTIQWKTKPGEKYAIHYSDARSGGAKWSVLPGSENVSGTGQLVQKTDHVPTGQQRYYRLIVVPVK